MGFGHLESTLEVGIFWGGGVILTVTKENKVNPRFCLLDCYWGLTKNRFLWKMQPRTAMAKGTNFRKLLLGENLFIAHVTFMFRLTDHRALAYQYSGHTKFLSPLYTMWYNVAHMSLLFLS